MIRPVALFLILYLVGDLVSFIRIEPIPGYIFSVRQSAALVAAARLGPLPGLALMTLLMLKVGKAVGSYLSLAVYGLEAFFVGWARRRRPSAPLLMADGLYWPFVGLPLLAVLYRYVLHVSNEVLILILLKVWLNAICDAYLAGIVADSRGPDLVLGTSAAKSRSLHRYVRDRFLFLALPLLLLVLFIRIGEFNIEAQEIMVRRVQSGIALARASMKQGQGGADPDIPLLESLNPDEEGRFEYPARDTTENRGTSVPVKNGVFARLPESPLYPLERWRCTEYYGELAARAGVLRYTVSFKDTFHWLYHLYALTLLVVIVFLYGIYIVFSFVIRPLGRQVDELTAAARSLPERIANGETPFWPNPEITEFSLLSGEFKTVSDHLRSLVDELRDSNDRLESVVSERTEELKRLTEELRLLLAWSERGRELERKRISRELHDQMGQDLAGLRMGLYLLERKLGTVASPAAEKLAELRELLEDMSEGMRRILSDLRPNALDHLGLCEAVRNLAQERSRQSGIPIEFEGSLPPDCLPDEDRAIAIYRIAQESLSNALRHSGSPKIRVSLRPEGREIILETQDWGSGFDATAACSGGERTSFGLIGMRERCAALGGTLSVESRPGRGTRIRARIPLANQEQPCAF